MAFLSLTYNNIENLLSILFIYLFIKTKRTGWNTWITVIETSFQSLYYDACMWTMKNGKFYENWQSTSPRAIFYFFFSLHILLVFAYFLYTYIAMECWNEKLFEPRSWSNKIGNFFSSFLYFFLVWLLLSYPSPIRTMFKNNK